MDDALPVADVPLETPGSGQAIKKLRLPTPRLDGETLLYPPSGENDTLWQSNLRRATNAGQFIDIGGVALSRLKAQSREHILRMATKYSQQYGDFSAPKSASHFVMAGHQPELFHPGVWFKNFLLSELGRRFQCPAINLVVDNDVGSTASVRVPRISDGQPSTKLVPFDEVGYNLPYEERKIENMDVFRSFEARATKMIRPFVDNPLLRRLWPEAISAAENLSNPNGVLLGASIAAGRHRLEAKLGLRTLEVPLSQIANCESFVIFMFHIFSNLHRFRDVYNASLADYREAYNLRSRSHPVPELERRDDWIEVPFWVWHTDHPFRKRLFVRSLGSSFWLSDLEGWQSEVQEKFPVDELIELSGHGIKIRPRALMTTMFCRLLLSDLFIHGIGGAKYDQLTNLIAARFFGKPLPDFCAASATRMLPTGTVPVTSQDITEKKQTLRQLKFHPERFIDLAEFPAAQSLVDTKYDWIQQNLPPNRLTERHQAIENCNQRMQEFVQPQRQLLERQIKKMTSQQRAHQILGSREFSFSLFPETIADELQKMAPSSAALQPGIRP